MMSDELANQLNNNHRDALLAYYKGYVAPTLAGETDITDEDIYQYLLIDTDISEAVNTSKVAQAISSLQTYIYRVALNQEPDFNPMRPDDLEEWREIDSQYAIWAAAEQVNDYPENYVSAFSRKGKSVFFRELEDRLNQNQLDRDQVQGAVLAYLNEFEDVANLQVVNGYCDEVEFDKGKYFFVGRTAEQPYRYYWRCMDLTKNGGSADNPVITPNCWNDWQPIDLPLSGDTVLSWTVRPVYFNDRLYVCWAERNPTPINADSGIHQYSIHYGYLRFDDTWAAPAFGDLQTTTADHLSVLLPDKVLEIDETYEFELTSIDTVALVDFNREGVGDARIEGNLFIGLFKFHPNAPSIDKTYNPRAFVYYDTSMLDLETTTALMEANFKLYKPTTVTAGIRAQPIQYCSLGKTFELVEGSLQAGATTGTAGDRSWGDSFPTPTVKILEDGETLEAITSVGYCPFTANDPAHRYKWWRSPTVTVPLHETKLLLEDNAELSLDWFCDANGNRVDGAVFTKDGNHYRSEGLYIYITGPGKAAFGKILIYNKNRQVESIIVENFHPDATNKWGAFTIEFTISQPFDAVYVWFQNVAGRRYILTNYLDFTEAHFPVNTFEPEIELRLYADNQELEYRNLPKRTEYEPGTGLEVTHRIHLTTDNPVNGLYKYQVRAKMLEWADHQEIFFGEKVWTFQAHLVDNKTPKIGPNIRSRYDENEGTVQFLTLDGLHNTLNPDGDDGDANVTSLADGGWLVTWSGLPDLGTTFYVYQQRYNRNGGRVGPKTKVNVSDGQHYASSAAGLLDGGWVVAWLHSSIGKIKQQRFDKNGNKVGNETEVGNSRPEINCCVSALEDGGWVVVWQASVTGGYDILQRVYNARGEAGSVTKVNTEVTAKSNLMQRPTVARLVEGGWVVTWIHKSGSSQYRIMMRHYDALGRPINSGVAISAHGSEPDSCCICGLEDGGWVIGWVVEGSVYYQRFTVGGNGVKVPIRANGQANHGVGCASIAGLDDGGWVVTWQTNLGGEASWDILQQRYDSDGDPEGHENRVNSFTKGDQNVPVIVGLQVDDNGEDAGWVVAWVSTGQGNVKRSVYQQRYSVSGRTVGWEDHVSASALESTRLNTTFVPLLITKANHSLDALMSYVTQATPVEPRLQAHDDAEFELEPMDYLGANGLYFWELFFHVPFMVGSRFATEGQHELAQKWFQYIFDPGAKNKEEDIFTNITAPDYWNNFAISVGADVTNTHSYVPGAYTPGALLDPDALAYANPVIYQKTVFIAYVETLIGMGDSQFRRVTREGLTAARVYYDMALELLGPSPDVTLSEQWQTLSLETLTNLQNSSLRSFEETAALNVLDMPSANSSALIQLDNPNFRAPLNSELLAHWKTLDARIYNLRHNLSIDGRPLDLPLYEPPADPRALLSQRAQAGSHGNSAVGSAQIVLPYRFQSLLPVATSAVTMLTQYGDQLLSFIERGEAAQQLELGQQQMVDLSGFAISLQKQELNALKADAETLKAQKAIADQRYEFYWSNFNENISDGEQESMDLMQESTVFGNIEKALYISGGAADLAPNIFGLAGGGMHLGALTRAIGEGIGLSRQTLEIQSARLAQTESYRRRRDDWQEQYIQAQLESEMIGKQLDALAVRQKAVGTSIEQATLQQKQQQDMLKFLNARFTRASLYHWLNGQLSALYYQAYDSVLSLCLNVQSCWQYEQGDFATTFVRTNAWHNSYRGLLAGQALTLDLQKMERAYYTRNDRQLNISRTVSLKALLSAQGKDFETEKKKGRFENFKLTQQLFDNDYPGLYARRLHKVSVTLPTLLGPYQNVRALLTQTSSSTTLKADISAVKALLNGTTPPVGSGVVTNLRPSQQVALSGGLADDGTFTLLVQDGRYLPFEGTGAVSGWTLEFPRSVDEKIGSATFAADAEQKALLDALDDVLIHVEYTALNGGASFATEVRKALHEKTVGVATQVTQKRPALKAGGSKKPAVRKK
jgi:hypothetical protein